MAGAEINQSEMQMNSASSSRTKCDRWMRTSHAADTGEQNEQQTAK